MIEEPAFYSYAYPAPDGLPMLRRAPGAGLFPQDARRICPALMSAVRTARDPEQALMDFLQSTCDAAANLGYMGPQGAGMHAWRAGAPYGPWRPCRRLANRLWH